MNYSAHLKYQWQNRLLIPEEEFYPCSKQEIDDLEEQTSQYTGFGLPKDYKLFLALGGKGVASVYKGTGMSFNKVLSRMKTVWQQKGVVGQHSLPNNAFLFFYKEVPPNHYALFLLDGQENPNIYEYYTDDNVLKQTNSNFKEFNDAGIENVLSFKALVPEAYRQKLFEARKILATMYFHLSDTGSSFWEKCLRGKIERFREQIDRLSDRYLAKEEESKIYRYFKVFLDELSTHTIVHISKENPELGFFLDQQAKEASRVVDF